jgi:hypothetical protein
MQIRHCQFSRLRLLTALGNTIYLSQTPVVYPVSSFQGREILLGSTYRLNLPLEKMPLGKAPSEHRRERIKIRDRGAQRRQRRIKTFYQRRAR